ncbi:MAG TPA: hypothetical protein VET83_10875 [Candidatus Dormibacteraeota bacterium]|nr:hypothetical protein [Candidatus Dormibacteraeota bacterium]
MGEFWLRWAFGEELSQRLTRALPIASRKRFSGRVHGTDDGGQNEERRQAHGTPRHS